MVPVVAQMFGGSPGLDLVSGGSGSFGSAATKPSLAVPFSPARARQFCRQQIPGFGTDAIFLLLDLLWQTFFWLATQIAKHYRYSESTQYLD
jgi:hypothetical protein